MRSLENRTLNIEPRTTNNKHLKPIFTLPSRYLKTKSKFLRCLVLHSTISFIRFAIAMKKENTKAQMRKGVLEYCILSLIHEQGAAYQADILKELKDARLLVVEGTLYPLLSRLKQGGYLTYQWIESKQGPPRKYYQLTVDGEELLNELEQTWQELAGAVQSITQKNKGHEQSD